MAEYPPPPASPPDPSPKQSTPEGALRARRAHFAAQRPSPTASPRASPRASPPPSPTRGPGAGDGNSLQEQLLQALLDNDLSKFEKLVADKRVDKSYKYRAPHHSTCLEVACRYPRRAEFVRLLLEYVKPNVNKVVPEPIHYAAQRGHADSLQVLLADKRTKVYALNSKAQTALHLACANVSAQRAEEYTKCIELLISKLSIADINKPDRNGFTAFHTLVRGQIGKGKKRKSGLEDEEGTENRKEEQEGDEEEWAARGRIAESMLRLMQGALDVDSARTKGRSPRQDVELRFPQLCELLPARREEARPLHGDPHQALVTALRERRLAVFSELLQRTDADGNPALDPNHAFGPPLHATCLELACKMADGGSARDAPATPPRQVGKTGDGCRPREIGGYLRSISVVEDYGGADFVRVLLEAGADPNVPNTFNEKYPIHIACEYGHVSALKALLECSTVEVDINCEDKCGNTPLHCTVDRISDDTRREAGRRRCLELLLDQEQLDITRRNKAGYTAFLLAVEDGNIAAIKTFLRAKRYFGEIDFKSINFHPRDSSTLRDSITEQYPHLKDLLYCTGTADTLRLRKEKERELFQLLNPVREVDFVRQLEKNLHLDLSTTNDKKFTLLQRAVRYGMVDAVKALLAANVNPNGTFSGNTAPPGVIACFHHQYEVLQVLVMCPDFDVNATDSKGNTALHYAAKAEHLESVVLLLRHGANMYALNKMGRFPLGKEQVESLLDQCVITNGKNALDEDYELILDYRLLAPGSPVRVETDEKKRLVLVECGNCTETPYLKQKSDNPIYCSEMDFLNMMSKNWELRCLLDHPVTLSFLNLKWNRLKFLSIFNFWLYIIFILFLDTYIIIVTKTIYKFSVIDSFAAIITGGIALLFWGYLVLREFSQCILGHTKYFKSIENYLDWTVLLFSVSSLVLPFAEVNKEIIKNVHAITIMLTSFELVMLLGRVSRFAKYIEMLKVVMKNYLLPLLSYAIILVAFGLSFYTLSFEKQMEAYEKSLKSPSNCTDDKPNDFGSWYMPIVMPLVMMIGEVDFKSLPDRSAQSIVLFVMFVLLVTIVLLNLLTGLAVSDTAKIESAAKQLRLRSRVGVCLRSERILVNLFNWDCAPARFCRRRRLPLRLRRAAQRALLFPDACAHWRVGSVRPNRTGEVVLLDGERQRLQRETLERATRVISRRGAAAAAGPSLADVDARLAEVLKALEMLDARGRHYGASPAGLSAYSEDSHDDWEPATPRPATPRTASPRASALVSHLVRDSA